MAQPALCPTQHIYVHIPFCEQKCAYCDFYTITDAAEGEARAAKWFDLLERELELWIAAGELDPSRPLSTLYLGGGTPSLTPASRLAQFAQRIRSQFQVAYDFEFTVEMQPGTADAAKLDGYLATGVNRFSIGTQTFQPDVLARTGRLHSVADGEALVSYLAGKAVVSIDLISGLPGHNRELWNRDLNRVLELAPDHISVYEMTYHAGTEFQRELKAGRLQQLSEDERLALFETTSDRLTRAGYEHYEISNYARPGCRSRHNENYWKLGNYVGLGAGAHSFVFPHRYINANSAASYDAAINAGHRFRRMSDPADSELFILENLQFGLRLKEGVNLDEFADRFGADPRQLWPQKIQQLVEDDFAEFNDPYLRLTRKGWLQIDSISQLLL